MKQTILTVQRYINGNKTILKNEVIDKLPKAERDKLIEAGMAEVVEVVGESNTSEIQEQGEE